MLSLREAPAPADGWMRHQCVMRACRLRLPGGAFGCFRLLSHASFFSLLVCYLPLAPPRAALAYAVEGHGCWKWWTTI